MTALLIFSAIIAASTVAIVGARYGWWTTRAERRSATPCRLCGRHHASAAERRACDDRGLS